MSQIPAFDFIEPTERISKLPRILLISRVVTLFSVVVSIVLLKINTFHKDGYRRYGYKDVSSYQYALFVMVVAFAYTLMQLPFAIYYLLLGKRLIKSDFFLQCDYYGDTVNSFLLGTGLGGYFGVTVDSKRYLDDAEFALFRSDFDKFYDIAYVSAGFLLLGFLASTLSCIISSRSLWSDRIILKK